MEGLALDQKEILFKIVSLREDLPAWLVGEKAPLELRFILAYSQDWLFLSTFLKFHRKLIKFKDYFSCISTCFLKNWQVASYLEGLLIEGRQ